MSNAFQLTTWVKMVPIFFNLISSVIRLINLANLNFPFKRNQIYPVLLL